MILDYIRGGPADAGGGDSLHVNDSLVGATPLDSIRERSTDLRHASQQSDGVLVSLDLSSIYTDALPLFQITRFCCKRHQQTLLTGCPLL